MREITPLSWRPAIYRRPAALLDGDENLDHLDDLREFIPTSQLIDLIFKKIFDQTDLLQGAFDDAIELAFNRFIIDSDIAPIGHGQLIEIFLRNFFPFIEKNLAPIVT